MPRPRRSAVVLTALALTAGAAVSAQAAIDPTVGPRQVVTHDNEKGWKVFDANAETTFVAGSEGCSTPPPLGTGSLSLTVNPPDGHAGLASVRYNRTYLRDLVRLDYWECTVANNGQQTPFLNLRVDLNGDNQADDTIVFEPTYQNPIDGGRCGAQSAQERPENGRWQHYDALRGPDGATAQACWWSQNQIALFPPGDIIRSLSEYVAMYPNAAIVNVEHPVAADFTSIPGADIPNPLGGVEVAMGDAGTAAQAYVDAFHIGDKNPNSSVTYDYEPAHS